LTQLDILLMLEPLGLRPNRFYFDSFRYSCQHSHFWSLHWKSYRLSLYYTERSTT